MPADGVGAGGRSRLPAALVRPAQTFSAQAVDVLREMVLSGNLRAGERLNEVELANALGISRGPLREAIQRLSSEGLLTTVSGRGAFVRTFTADGLRDLYEVRIALETHALRLAGSRTDKDTVEGLRQMLTETETKLGSSEHYPEDLDFHRQILALADNESLTRTATEIHRQISLARSRSGHVSVRARRAFDEHQLIVEELANGRVEKAAKLLTAHLHSSLESALAIFDTESVG